MDILLSAGGEADFWDRKYIKKAKDKKEKIKWLKEMIKHAPKHKGTEKLLAQLKKTLNKLEEELEKELEKANISLEDASIDEMEKLWNQAKKITILILQLMKVKQKVIYIFIFIKVILH